MTSNSDLIDGREAAKLMDVSIHTVRDYKKFGLLKIAAKRGNKDLYSKADLTQRHSIIDKKRREGYSLSQINSMLEGELRKMR
jgi:DNA-binding transcriptional MerR regulator